MPSIQHDGYNLKSNVYSSYNTVFDNNKTFPIHLFNNFSIIKMFDVAKIPVLLFEWFLYWYILMYYYNTGCLFDSSIVISYKETKLKYMVIMKSSLSQFHMYCHGFTSEIIKIICCLTWNIMIISGNPHVHAVIRQLSVPKAKRDSNFQLWAKDICKMDSSFCNKLGNIKKNSTVATVVSRSGSYFKKVTL